MSNSEVKGSIDQFPLSTENNGEAQKCLPNIVQQDTNAEAFTTNSSQFGNV